MIFIYELICKNHSHEACNAGFLKLYSMAYPNEKIFFYANGSHIDCIKKEFKNEINSGNLKNIYFKKISFLYENGLIHFIKKYLFIKREKKKWPNNKVIFLSYDVIILTLLKFILKKSKKNLFNLLLVSHGTFELLNKNQPNPRETFKNPYSFYQRIKIKILKPKVLIKLIVLNLKKIFNKFTTIPINIFLKDFETIIKSFDLLFVNFVLLSEHINLELKKIKKFENLKTLVIPMPVIFKNFPINFIQNKINFGIIGYGLPSDQLKLFSKLEKEKISNNFTFRLIGIQPDIFKNFKNVIIPEPNNKIILSRSEMEEEIKNIHFQIIFYPENSYRLSQSLSVFESLRYQKPIIHIKNSCVSFYNPKNLNIGIECNDINEMSLQIKSIVENLDNTRKLYKVFMENINLLREKYSIKNSTKILHQFYEKNA